METKMVNHKNVLVAVIVSILLQPFEVLQTSMITTKFSKRNINLYGLKEMIQEAYRLEGSRSFFRGTSLSILKNTSSYSLFFIGIENFSSKSHSHQSNFLVGALSKFMSSILVNPIAVIKTKMQIVGDNQFLNIRDCVKKTFQREGAVGFYRGLVPSLIRDSSYQGIQFSIYKGLLGQIDNPNTFQVAGCASLGSMASLLITYPLDNLRIRIQSLNLQKGEGSTLSLLSQVYKDEGIKGFYQGYLPRLLKRGLQSGVVWSVYEKVVKS
ncbi:hypothetical protein pb186bvf_013218 [Paramecium bursaria]